MTDEVKPRKPGTFTKNDPRINRKGRPRTYDAFRQLAQAISHEIASSRGQPIIIDGHKVTIVEAILRHWAANADPRIQQLFIEAAYGKAPQPVTGVDGGDIKIVVRVTDDD